MNLLEKIKSIFTKSKPKAISQTRTMGDPIHFQREDGSQFQLSPYLDKNEQQLFTDFTLADGTIRSLPKFQYFESRTDGSFIGSELFLDINPEVIPNYSREIANLLLSSHRAESIAHGYQKYVGGFIFDQKGKVQDIGEDPNITAIFEERSAENIARLEKRRKTLEKVSPPFSPREIHEESSPEGILTQEDLKGYYHGVDYR